MTSHCCEMMAKAIAPDCSVHPNSSDCPDALVRYSLKFDEYGIAIPDGGTAVLAISFCPWCGKRLPSRSQEWFEQLGRLGFDDPFAQTIPKAYESDAWYRRADRVAARGGD